MTVLTNLDIVMGLDLEDLSRLLKEIITGQTQGAPHPDSSREALTQLGLELPHACFPFTPSVCPREYSWTS